MDTVGATKELEVGGRVCTPQQPESSENHTRTLFPPSHFATAVGNDHKGEAILVATSTTPPPSLRPATATTFPRAGEEVEEGSAPWLQNQLLR